jgi:hypothetical protein
MRHSSWPAAFLLCGFFFTATGLSEAQLTEATLNGTVVDADGRGIPLATIDVVHTATAARRTATADNTGAFTIAGLPPGSYGLTAASAGFATVNQSGLRLSVGQSTAITIQLPIGSLQETISVRAGSVTVATSREARLADSFGGNDIQELPLPQRDIFALPKLSVGATAIPGAANSTKLSSSPVITVNGNRYRGNNYVLDGAMNTNPNNTGEPAIVPSLESVQEVQVQTLNFASEFGRGNGAVINISTKSGTNTFTGRAWEFHRSDTLNAKNHFATVESPQKFNHPTRAPARK